MATLTDLKKRLRSVQNICQLAGAMRTVSAAKRERVSVISAAYAPYARGCRELLTAAGGAPVPAREGEDLTLMVLLSGNRGLCGSYHNELFAFFRSLAEPERQVYITCGRKAAAYCRERGIPLLEDVPVSDVPRFSEAEDLADRILALYNGGRVSRVVAVWGEGVNALRQEPMQIELLPGEAAEPAQEALWVPDLATARAGLLEFCLRAQVYSLLLRGAAGVQGATLVSMRSAYDNGKKSAAALETAINRLRQSQVTSGVIETSSGFAPRGEE